MPSRTPVPGQGPLLQVLLGGRSDRLEELLTEWTLWMHDCSPRTIDARVLLVRRFEVETGADSLVCDWHPIAEFLDNPAWSPGTVQTHRAHLNAWFDWLARMDHRPDNPMRKLRRQRSVSRQPRPISNREMLRLLTNVNRHRTRAMILLAGYQGLRAHEIAKVRTEDFHDGTLTVLGKGSKLATLPVHPVVELLAEEFPGPGWWFPSYEFPDRPITSRNVSRVVSETMRRAGVNGTCHQLRHWFGTQLLEASLDLRSVQELMRHESPATTAKYTQVSDERRRAALAGLPLAGTASEILRRGRALPAVRPSNAG